MSDYTEEQIEAAIALVNSEVAERLEYEESHVDAGDAYAHMPREGGFDYGNGPSRLVEFCKAHDIAGSAEDLSDIVLDHFTMMSGNMYSPKGVFVVDSYGLQEVEIDLNYLVESGQIDWGLLMQISDDCDAYITGTGYAYVTSDAVWYAVIDPESLADLVADILGEQVTCELCDNYAASDEAIHTEDGVTVGECCRGELRAVSCDEQGETWYYAS